MRRREFILVFAGAVAFPISPRAQQATPSPKPKYPAEIAAASKVLAERNESCRLQAKEEKVAFLKRRRFIRDCIKNYQKTSP